MRQIIAALAVGAAMICAAPVQASYSKDVQAVAARYLRAHLDRDESGQVLWCARVYVRLARCEYALRMIDNGQAVIVRAGIYVRKVKGRGRTYKAWDSLFDYKPRHYRLDM